MRRMLALLSSLLVVSGLLAPATAQAATGTLLWEGMGSYPRVIRTTYGTPADRGHILAAITSQDKQGRYAPIFESMDEGKSFTKVGEVRDPEGAKGMCCGTLYELPQRVGRLRAGTLLWAASYRAGDGPTRRMGIRIWQSTDLGRSWQFLSEPVRSHNHDGVWEPEFNVDADGKLWMHYADETEAPRFSQVLNRVSSGDGVNWSSKVRTMAIPPDGVRPGMPMVRRLPDGRYYFGYEICNYGLRYCDPYFKISNDGKNFGETDAPGTQVGTAEGNHFQHAQTVTLFPGGPKDTRILMVGQIYVDRFSKKLPENGRMLLANDNLGSGDWYEVPAPVQVNDPYNNWCPNYSSTLLPVDNGDGVLQLAADYTDGVCKTYFGTGPSR